MADAGTLEVERLVGVYDADGTLVGEISYVLGHLIGRRTCSLCDITHSWRGRKQDFDHLAEPLGVPFELLHRNEVPPDLTDAATGWPSVLAITRDGPRELLDNDALATCAGAPDALFDAVDAALAARGLSLPTT